VDRSGKRLVVAPLLARILWAGLFAVGFAYVEASVVVYLRELLYPHGFGLPLALPPTRTLEVELGREAATILMLVGVSAVAASRFWERCGYFLLLFGVWDVFYYVWLKVICDWPVRLLDWDVLFLLPVPWLAPVVAPLSIALVMVVAGIWLIAIHARSRRFTMPAGAWLAGIAATGMILYSFMYDTGAAVRGMMPRSYPFGLLAAGIALYGIAGFFAHGAASSRTESGASCDGRKTDGHARAH
jgi:hypothetical protein